jgi:hypothetical protein
MKRHDGFARIALAAIALGLWVLILKPLVLPAPSRAAEGPQAAPLLVGARGLPFVNADGKRVAQISADQDGGSLQLFDAAGKPFAILGPSKDGGGLMIIGADGKGVAALGRAKDGGVLAISDTRGNGVGVMGAASRGAFFMLSDGRPATEGSQFGITALPEMVGLRIVNKQADCSVALGAAKQGPSISMLSKRKRVWRAP